mgnify:CR=1 FL=1
MIRNIEHKYLERPSTTHSGRGGYWNPVPGPLMDQYDRLLAVHLHIVDNYPYLDLVSDVTIRLDGEFITFVGVVRSFYLKQSLLAFAVSAVGTTYIRDEIQVSPVNPLTVLEKSQTRYQAGAAN